MNRRLTFVLSFLSVLSVLSVRCLALSSQPKATGYVRVVQEKGVWWFVDGQGKKFFSLGADCVGGCTGHYESKPIPADKKMTIVSQLKDWGFNTAGCWSRPSVWKDFYVADQIYSGLAHGQEGRFDDMYDPVRWR